MNNKNHLTKAFRQLHHAGEPFLLPNVWDSFSAKLVAVAGFPAIGTASIAVAAVNNYPDGERIPFNVLTDVVRRINSVVNRPITVDMESGYGSDISILKDNVRQLIHAGAIGVNIEDVLPGSSGLLTLKEQCSRITAVRKAAEECGVDFFINARTDVLLRDGTQSAYGDLLTRGKAYRDAGADCFYPILIDSYLQIEKLISGLDMPVNVLLTPSIGNIAELKNCGVARVSLGPGLLKYLVQNAIDVLEALKTGDTTAYFITNNSHPDILNELVSAST
ncbi:MAG: isocitrate lyase/phosphoenolpyruvate mutase family protein [Mucilaginibacter sp.]|nr:isocitrate lyase/phosphoenolpyruvate mutase family protein [Mucilaginibacter sp.]